MDKTINLETILALHKEWLRGTGGTRANLQGANLRDAYLQGANLRGANLQGADLQGANLRDANLQGANLRDANLQGADLQGANLRDAYLQDAYLQDAYLQDANLQSAYLQGANLQGADLQGADLQEAKGVDLALAIATHLPEGQFDAWKMCKDRVLAHIRIPADAKRSHGAGRKCRAEFVEVLEVIGSEVGISIHDGKTEYRRGTIVKSDFWCEDRWETCAPGIHFYLTRLEAENHH